MWRSCSLIVWPAFTAFITAFIIIFLYIYCCFVLLVQLLFFSYYFTITAALCIFMCEWVIVGLTMAIYCIISEIKWDIDRKSRFFHIPFDAPVKGSPSEYCHTFWCGETRMVWLADGGKIWGYVSLFDRMSSVVWRTDRQTDRHTHCAVKNH